MDKPKKPVVRLKVPFRFLATPTMMATIPKGEVGRVLSSTKSHHCVIFGKDAIVPDEGLPPPSAHTVEIAVSDCEVLPDSDGPQSRLVMVVLPPSAKECGDKFSGPALLCLACDRTYEAPESQEAYTCPKDGIQLVPIVI